MSLKHTATAPYALNIAVGFSSAASLALEILLIRAAYSQVGLRFEVLALILSSFMGGMALATLLVERCLPRMHLSPRTLYALSQLSGLGLIFFRKELFYNIQNPFVLFVVLLFCLTILGLSLPVCLEAYKSTHPQNPYASWARASFGGSFVGLILTSFIMFETWGLKGSSYVWAGAFMLSLLLFWNLPLKPPTLKLENLKLKTNKAALSLKTWVFIQGFLAIGLQAYWSQLLSPYLAQNVYNVSFLLLSYLLFSALGSWVQKENKKTFSFTMGLFVWMAALGLSFLLGAPSLHRIFSSYILCLGLVGLFAFVNSFLFAQICDRHSPSALSLIRWNSLGCTVGPLVVTIFLAPFLSHFVLALLLLSAAALGALYFLKTSSKLLPSLGVFVVGLAVISMFSTFEEDLVSRFPNSRLLNEREGKTVALQEPDTQRKRLYVGGFETTFMGPITADMAHAPLWWHQGHPEKALNLCFGMGTTFTGLRSWGLHTTAVDLMNSVFSLYPFFQPLAPEMLSPNKYQFVKQDARSYLMETQESFDIITIDPPPPTESIYSSGFYTREFYQLVKSKMKPNAILAQWIPENAGYFARTAYKALKLEFPYLKIFIGVQGFGLHLIASMTPLVELSPQSILSKMPVNALNHFLQSHGAKSSEAQSLLVEFFNGEVPESIVVPDIQHIEAMTDDRPHNEFYFLRRYLNPWLFGSPNPDQNTNLIFKRIDPKKVDPGFLQNVYERELAKDPLNRNLKKSYSDFCKEHPQLKCQKR